LGAADMGYTFGGLGKGFSLFFWVNELSWWVGWLVKGCQKHH